MIPLAPRVIAAIVLAACIATATAQTAPRSLRFQPQRLTGAYLAEGVGTGDFDNDGILDVACGRLWWKGPTFRIPHKIAPVPRRFRISTYSDVFFTIGHDVDGDGWDDILWIGFPGGAAHWFENPGTLGTPWTKHTVAAFGVGVESPIFEDLDGDGVHEIVCASGGQLGSFEPGPAGVRAPWVFNPITPPGPWGIFTHGLGVGDVNQDGRNDVLTVIGWFEQPAVPSDDWPLHLALIGLAGAQMFTFDADGDGDQDIATSKLAHGYGLSWFEQTGPGGQSFVEHPILPATPTAPWHFSQLHAVAVADLDGDGFDDIVTGKTFWAHLGTDPGALDPAVLYAFAQRRGAGGTTFLPVPIHDNSGVGRGFELVDLNADGRIDIVTANKKGVFVFWNRGR